MFDFTTLRTWPRCEHLIRDKSSGRFAAHVRPVVLLAPARTQDGGAARLHPGTAFLCHRGNSVPGVQRSGWVLLLLLLFVCCYFCVSANFQEIIYTYKDVCPFRLVSHSCPISSQTTRTILTEFGTDVPYEKCKWKNYSIQYKIPIVDQCLVY
jgi:hypothetical protein